MRTVAAGQVHLRECAQRRVEGRGRLERLQPAVGLRRQVRLCLARNRYKAGTSTMGNLLEAQLLSQQSKDKLTDAYADLKMRQLDYSQATGPSRTF